MNREHILARGQQIDAQGRALCMCGCGQPVEISKETRPHKDRVRGEPLRYIKGHSPLTVSPQMTPPNPSGKCWCGCGGDAPIAKLTNRQRGAIKGEPLRYIQGHNPKRGLAAHGLAQPDAPQPMPRRERDAAA